MSQAEEPPSEGLPGPGGGGASLAATASLSLDLPPLPVVVGGPHLELIAFDEAAVSGKHAEAPEAATDDQEEAAAAGSPRRRDSLQHSLPAVVRRGTEVWTWGRGDCGQLGDGALDDSHVPRQLPTLEGRVCNLAAGALHTAAVTSDGELYVFGSNDAAQLGIRGGDVIPLPARVEALENFKVRHVACGASHTVALVDDGALAAFGNSEHGQTGLVSTGTQVDLPRVVKELRRMRIVRVAAGGSHTLALSSTGGVFSWGSGHFGALGRGTTEGTQVPRPISRLWPLGVVQIACGENHSAALTVDGRLLTWGRGKYGALGLGDFENRSAPQPVQALAGVACRQVSCGDDHTVVLAADGSVYTWGRGTWGQTGQSHLESISHPTRVAGLAGQTIVQVAAGGRHTLALGSDNRLWGFGCNDSGQLAAPPCGSQPTPQRLLGLPDCPILFVMAGGDHTAVVVDRAGSRQAAAAGPCATRTHGEQWCPVEVPDLVQLTAQVAAHKGDSAALGAVTAAVESIFSSPGYLLATFSRQQQVQRGEDHQQQQQQTSSDTHGAATSSKQQELQQQDSAFAGGGEHHQRQNQHQGRQSNAGPPAVADEAAPMGLSPSGQRPAALERAAAEYAAPMDEQQLPQGPQQSHQEQHAAKEPPPAAARTPTYVSRQQQEQYQQGQQQQQQQPQPPQQQFQQQQQQRTLDVQRIGATFQALLTLYEPQVAATLGNTCIRLLNMLEKFLNSLQQQQQDAAGAAGKAKASGGGSVGSDTSGSAAGRQDLGWVAPVLFVLLQNPLNSETGSYGGKLLMHMSRILSVTLPAHERLVVAQALRALLSRLPPDVLAARCVRPLQKYIEHCVHAGLEATRVQVMMAGVLVDVLRQANKDGGGLVSYAEFHSKALSEHGNLQAEYETWLQNKDGTALVSFCQMPYLLTPEAKSRIMHGEAAMQQQRHLSSAALQALFQGAHPASAAYLHIQVRRTHVVEDALNQLVHREADLKKPLRVTFISGGVAEPAQDEGGVTKEFFQLLTRDLFKQDYGMFTYDELTRTYWFNPASLESELEFALVGALLGLAIYNAVILDVHFPLVVYQKLLGQAPSFEDLKAAFPDLGRGLQQLLEFDGDVEAVFCRSFSVEYEFYGEMRSEELKPGGADIPVTADNREEYVRLYSEWVLVRSIQKQFAAFRHGFLRVCNGPALTLFSPLELELLICGLPHLDFEQLEKAAKYEGGYHRDHPEVRWFWEVLHSLGMEQKRAFLQFTTGSDRAPVGGLAKLPLLIQRAGPDTDRLPTSHTCFNALLVPEYGSKGKLKERLLTAVENAQGFGLQ